MELKLLSATKFPHQLVFEVKLSKLTCMINPNSQKLKETTNWVCGNWSRTSDLPAVRDHMRRISEDFLAGEEEKPGRKQWAVNSLKSTGSNDRPDMWPSGKSSVYSRFTCGRVVGDSRLSRCFLPCIYTPISNHGDIMSFKVIKCRHQKQIITKQPAGYLGAVRPNPEVTTNMFYKLLYCSFFTIRSFDILVSTDW